jgi:hypothetical protein
MPILSLPVLSGSATMPLVKGNDKLSKGAHRIVGFGIPADADVTDPVTGATFNTCSAALACKAVCYAKQGSYAWKNTIAARQRALSHSFSDSFVTDMVAKLGRSRAYDTVRIHDSGDFYSQEYLEKWYSIARALPRFKFYAYTKRLDLDLWSNKPANFSLVQSLGGRFDSKVDLTRPHSRIFSSMEARDAAGYVDGNISDDPAIEGQVRIGLVYHGTKSLTPAQVKFFK